MPRARQNRRPIAPIKAIISSYGASPSHNGNELFERLPPEIRFMIWNYVMNDAKYSVNPIYKPKQSLFERFEDEGRPFRRTPSAVTQLNAILQTCRLFWYDQAAHRAFYKSNVFQFYDIAKFTTYIAAISPSRRQAIRHVHITYMPQGFHHSKHANEQQFIPILSLCTQLRSLTFGFHYSSFRDNSSPAAFTACLKPIVRAMPQLREVLRTGSFGSGFGARDRSFRCRIDANGWELTREVCTHITHTKRSRKKITTEHIPTIEKAQKALEGVRALFRKPRIQVRHLQPNRTHLKLFAATPLKVYGEHRETVDDLPLVSDHTRSRAVRKQGVRIPRAEETTPGFGYSSWLSWQALFHADEQLPDVVSQSHVEYILGLLAKKRYTKEASMRLVHPRLLIDLVKGLGWQDRQIERHVLCRLRRLGAMFERDKARGDAEFEELCKPRQLRTCRGR